jgi:peptidoglycan-associated lipoprotein
MSSLLKRRILHPIRRGHQNLTKFPHRILTASRQIESEQRGRGAFAFKVDFDMMTITSSTSLKLVLALGLSLSLAACSKKTTAGLGADGLGGSGGAGSGLNGDIAQIPGSEEDFSTNVGDRIFFNEDKSMLSEEAKDTLLKQASWLKQYPDVLIQVEGHADERGTREYNISLSARRATAARNFLIENGISAKRVSSIAYGKERPAKLCDSEECWSQNRRAVTVITAGARTS